MWAWTEAARSVGSALVLQSSPAAPIRDQDVGDRRTLRYATGREHAEFFMAYGPWGGLLGMLVAMICWNAVCVATFAFARATPFCVRRNLPLTAGTGSVAGTEIG